MTAVLSETEGDPLAWPAVTGHFPIRDAETVDSDRPTVDPAVTWRRLESWIARRWPARSVVYVIEGPGHWAPRLYPFAVSTAEVWADGAWSAVTLGASPLGYALDAGTYRLTGTAGDDTDPPEDVKEAWRRLHEYSLGVARSWWNETAEYQHEETRKVAAWAAKALHLSGAADLLRPYRRLGA